MTNGNDFSIEQWERAGLSKCQLKGISKAQL
ncbi:MAG: hypothetical protein H6R18_1237 [Proteobacteria bacterium]|nr:hypothetical protein [Pseudomonadota bacterium]